MSALVTLENISKRYQESIILDNINLVINHGDFIAITGPSGSGKSTLLNIIGLLDRPTSGALYFAEKNISTCNADKLAALRNQHIGFVFQQFHLLKNFTALQNVVLPLTLRRNHNHHDIDKALTMLDRVNMQPWAAQKPTQLSGGQQQRVAIARALVTNPAIILADEPTGALDIATATEIMELFIALNQDGHTIVIITHDPSIAARCPRRLAIANGRLTEPSLCA